VPRDEDALRDMLDPARLAMSYVDGLTAETFAKLTEKQDAVVRRLEVVGEAVARVSEPFKSEHPEVPWAGIRAMRNVMAHQYDVIDCLRVWKTVKEDLPPLIEQLQHILGED